MLLAGAALPGCAGNRRNSAGPEHPAVEVPAKVGDLDTFAVHRNAYALLAVDHPQRPAIRERLVDFLLDYMDEQIRGEHYEEASTALHFLTDLYAPIELRTGSHTDPRIAAAAHKVYIAAARRGNESPALFALAVEHHFAAEKARKRALGHWRDLEEWILRNGVFSDEPILRHEELEETLEETAAAFPSPFVVQRLADLYVARYEAAQAAMARGAEIGVAARQRAEVTGYLLIRLYLRADDFDGTIAALKRINPDVPTRKMMEFLARAEENKTSASSMLTLATQFVPEVPDEYSRIPPSFVTQGWGIVDNLARRAVRRFPDDPFAHHLLASALRQQGLLDAAIHHFQATLRLKPDTFDAWQELALLHQMTLERLSARSPEKAQVELKEIEDFHRRAADLWKDRPLEPGLPDAYVTVAEALYNSGRIEPARELLRRSLKSEPVADALYLLATIEAKGGDDTAARGHFEALLELPFGSQLERLRWETTARANLGRIADRAGKKAEAEEQLRVAIRQLNSLIAFPSLDDDLRSAFLVERGKTLFDLGDGEQAMADFRQARLSTPDRIESYTDPMLFVVSRGYYQESREIYRQVIARDEIRDTLKLYFSLWIYDLSIRQGQEDPEAAAFLKTYDAEPWPKKLALHARGQLAFDELLSGARDPGERAEAYFYEGLRRWRTGNAQGGKELLRKVLATKMMGFFEYDMALYYLQSGDLPRTDPAATAKR